MKQILVVDDEPAVLGSLERALAKHYSVDTALGAKEGLAKLEQAQELPAVVVVDMNMPEMNGVAFLAEVRKRWPDIVRLMLTANKDQLTAAEAVNEGSIFRFLNKPCPPDRLQQALAAAVRYHDLIVAEKELLEKTLRSSVGVLTDLLALSDPQQWNLAQMVRDQLKQLAGPLGFEASWELDVSAMLARIGAMTIPPEVLLKARREEPMSLAEQQLILRVPEMGFNLLASIPRLQGVARNILYQDKHFDGTGFPNDLIRGEEIPFGARLLKLLGDFARLTATDVPREAAVKNLQQRSGWYDPHLLSSVSAIYSSAPEQRRSLTVNLEDLRVGHRLLSPIETVDGMRIVSADYVITEALLGRLRNFSHLTGIKQPLLVEASESMPE